MPRSALDPSPSRQVSSCSSKRANSLSMSIFRQDLHDLQDSFRHHANRPNLVNLVNPVHSNHLNSSPIYIHRRWSARTWDALSLNARLPSHSLELLNP